MTLNLIRLLALVSLLSLLAACSSTVSGEKADYKKQVQAEENLEIPPNLTSGSIQDSMKVPDMTSDASATFSDFSDDRQAKGSRLLGTAVLPEIEKIKVHRDGNQRWLEIEGSPEDVWYQVIEFWRDSGLLLVEQDPTVGTMKTDWMEDRADIDMGGLTEIFRKALNSIYSSGTRDQFRVRLERGEQAGITHLFLTHRGMEEQLKGETTFWVSVPNDHELEAVMLHRLMVFMGMDEAQAVQDLAQKESRKMRAQLIKDEEQAELLINEPFSRAWRLTGVALDRVGFAVEDRDRANGLFFVRYDDPDRESDEGWFSSLFSSDEKIDGDNQYQVKLVGQDEQTHLQILNHQGQRDSSSTATRIIGLIYEQIR
ncbi:MAG: outer membrane protein assembly factor BamC [Candidatus Polarisedimenticolaceae bacterium]|nr:outer membrane protein assembly factor BamC [Candidatus Polarisedimenticolaceae bacterium]